MLSLKSLATKFCVQVQRQPCSLRLRRAPSGGLVGGAARVARLAGCSVRHANPPGGQDTRAGTWHVWLGIPRHTCLGVYRLITVILLIYICSERSQNLDLGWVREWSDLWGMKLNESKIKTMRVSGSHTIHTQSHALTIGGIVLKESDDFDILGATFNSKVIFE